MSSHPFRPLHDASMWHTPASSQYPVRPGIPFSDPRQVFEDRAGAFPDAGYPRPEADYGRRHFPVPDFATRINRSLGRETPQSAQYHQNTPPFACSEPDPPNAPGLSPGRSQGSRTAERINTPRAQMPSPNRVHPSRMIDPQSRNPSYPVPTAAPSYLTEASITQTPDWRHRVSRLISRQWDAINWLYRDRKSLLTRLENLEMALKNVTAGNTAAATGTATEKSREPDRAVRSPIVPSASHVKMPSTQSKDPFVTPPGRSLSPTDPPNKPQRATTARSDAGLVPFQSASLPQERDHVPTTTQNRPAKEDMVWEFETIYPFNAEDPIISHRRRVPRSKMHHRRDVKSSEGERVKSVYYEGYGTDPIRVVDSVPRNSRQLRIETRKTIANGGGKTFLTSESCSSTPSEDGSERTFTPGTEDEAEVGPRWEAMRKAVVNGR
ncbi:hypothetical protein M8818_003811 [Zalaria obscura]|uniref:Uncharacterized protein n=1 Tax=Zalaria obscura TaxID=2024903 RepID=A0ACC3SDY6_9PEZI